MPMNAQDGSFYEVLTAAINDFAEFGYDDAERLAYWNQELRRAAIRSMTAPHVLEATLRETLKGVYRSKVERGGILGYHPEVSRFRLENVKPKLRSELDRRIMASADLIKLNRQATIDKTLQRFSGWATSIPVGGSDAIERAKTKTEIRKALVSLPYEERRVLIDQGHKFVASLSNIIANDNNAIALIWHSHWRQKNYNFREEHKERDGMIYMIRGNWAQKLGLVKPGPAGYYDEITAVGEEVFCRCYAQYLYAVRALPADMVTDKGREALAKVRRAA